MKQVLKRTPNQVFHDELSPSMFYLLTEENRKDYFLVETSEGSWEWQDFGTRENAGGCSFESFEDAIAYALDSGNLTMHDSRRGVISELHRRTEDKFNTFVVNH